MAFEWQGADLAVDVVRSRSGAHITLAGELDLATAPRLERAFTTVLLERERSVVILDLRELVFMDSSGLRAVLRCSEAAGQVGRRLAIVRGRDDVDRVFRMTGLDSRLDLVDEPPLPSGPE